MTKDTISLDKIAQAVNEAPTTDPTVIRTKGTVQVPTTEPIPVGTLPTKPATTVDNPTNTTKESVSYLTVNLGNNAQAVPTVDESTKQKDYIKYGVIVFVVLLVLIMVIKARKSK